MDANVPKLSEAPVAIERVLVTLMALAKLTIPPLVLFINKKSKIEAPIVVTVEVPAP